MKLIDIEKLDYETFMMEDGEVVDYISAENLWKAPRVDLVNHAEWVMNILDRMYTEPDKMLITHTCSHCGQQEHADIIPIVLWELGYKNQYKPKLSNYCRECGYKMDLRELYEQYKREWCEDRGYNLEDMDEEVGINGECYACFDEWYQNEYLEEHK